MKLIACFLSLLIFFNAHASFDSTKYYQLILDEYWRSQQNTNKIISNQYIKSKKHCSEKFKFKNEFTFNKIGPIKKIPKENRHSFQVKIETLSKRKKHLIYRIDLFPKHPSKKLDKRYRFYYFKSLVPYQSSEKHPLVIISPSIKGIKTGMISGIENKFAIYFAKYGVSSIITDLGEDILINSRPIKDIDNWFIAQINGLRLTLDYAISKLSHEIDTDKISAMGASLGGIRTALFMAFEPQRIKAGVIIASGGHFADLWSSSKQKMVKKYRKFRMKAEQIPGKNKKEKLEYLYKYVKKITCTDPLFFTHKRPNFSDDIKMYLAGRDTKVPTKVQLELWKALGMPTNAEITTLNHRPTILKTTNSKKDQILQFFDYKFNN